jgi:hypothetical protein
MLTLLAGLGVSTPAMAYIDPNAGGWLFQLLFPLIVAIGAAWAGLRARISVWWARIRGRTPPSERIDDA